MTRSGRSWTSSCAGCSGGWRSGSSRSTLTDAARDYLANKGYDPAFGARPLKRLIQREIQDPLAMKLLSGDINDGDSVEIDAGDGGLVFGTGRTARLAVSGAEAADTCPWVWRSR